MAYVKNTFIDGETVLKAEHLNAIEDGIVANETAVTAVSNALTYHAPQIYNHTPQRKTVDEQIKILCFGSSWFLNTWFYLNKITNNLGINAKIHGYYMGHSQFNEWIAFYQNDLSPFAGSESTRQAYQYISENGANYTSQKHVTGGTFGDQEYRDAWYNDLLSEDWDIIAFQQGAHQSVQSDKWDNANQLVSIIKRHCGPNTVIAFNNTWTPSISSNYLSSDTNGACDKTLEGQQLWQQMNWNNCLKMMNDTGIMNVSPNGAMIYTMRRDSSLNIDDGYDLMKDGLHPDHGLTMYGVSGCFYETFVAPFYGISIKNCTWLPTSSNQKAPFNTYFRAIDATQQTTIHDMIRLSLSNRFSFNVLETIAEDSDTTVDVDEEGYYALPVSCNSLGVTSAKPGRVVVSTATSKNRLSTADETDANGILVGANETIHLKGLTSGNYPLRVDYCYATSAGPNPTGDAGWDACVGCANGGDDSNYFPLNADGSSDTLSITNTHGADYYFFFAFAGVTKSEVLELASYDLRYKIETAE